jgi:hypothetical protein
MRHAHISTTMNVYGNALMDSKREANSRVARMALGMAGGPQRKSDEVRGGGSCRGRSMRIGPLFTSVLVRLIGPLYVVPTGPPSHSPRLRFPHRRYRIIFIEGAEIEGAEI